MKNCDFDELNLNNESLDGVHCRWALAGVPNPVDIVQKVKRALKPGGVFIAQEYYDWSTFQFTPYMPALSAGIQAALKKFKEKAINMNVGRDLPKMFYDQGLEVINIRSMSKLATPDDLTWQWPKTFLEIYLPELVDTGYLTKEQESQALEELIELEYIDGANCLCPQMVEVIGIKL